MVCGRRGKERVEGGLRSEEGIVEVCWERSVVVENRVSDACSVPDLRASDIEFLV